MNRIRQYAEQVEIERDRAVEALRVLNEETVLAGFPGGDRAQTLANVRAMATLLAEVKGALEQIDNWASPKSAEDAFVTWPDRFGLIRVKSKATLARINAAKGVGL